MAGFLGTLLLLIWGGDMKDEFIVPMIVQHYMAR